MQGCQLIRVVAPSTASATCLLSDLVPVARVRAISHIPDGCELLLATKGEVLAEVAEVVADWLRRSSIESAELWADGRRFVLSADGGSVKSGPVPDGGSKQPLAAALTPLEPSAV